MRKLKLQEPSPPRGKFPVLPPTPPREASEPFPATWPLSHDLVWFDGAVGLGGECGGGISHLKIRWGRTTSDEWFEKKENVHRVIRT